jgi:penicillin-binding protein 2
VASKTGTAEYGRLNADGQYEHTHAWNIGFFPYDNPKYAFVIFMEDGGTGNNAAQVAKTFLENAGGDLKGL